MVVGSDAACLLFWCDLVVVAHMCSSVSSLS
jgi:hypothetical protein